VEFCLNLTVNSGLPFYVFDKPTVQHAFSTSRINRARQLITPNTFVYSTWMSLLQTATRMSQAVAVNRSCSLELPAEWFSQWRDGRAARRVSALPRTGFFSAVSTALLRLRHPTKSRRLIDRMLTWTPQRKRCGLGDRVYNGQRRILSSGSARQRVVRATWCPIDAMSSKCRTLSRSWQYHSLVTSPVHARLRVKALTCWLGPADNYRAGFDTCGCEWQRFIGHLRARVFFSHRLGVPHRSLVPASRPDVGFTVSTRT